MNFTRHTFYPRPSLSCFIQCYQFFKIKNETDCSLVQEEYPRTAMDMIFTFNGSVNIMTNGISKMELSKFALVGLLDKKYEIHLSKELIALHVRFKPNGIYPLTKIPMDESWTKQISLDQLIGNDIVFLYDDLGNASGTNEKIELLENYLESKYNSATIHHKFNYCLNQINDYSNLSVAQLACSSNSNYKSLDRWFKKFVGTSPKNFLQLNRFKNILTRLEKEANIDWMQLVSDFGFHDQSHFIRQFKSIADRTPSDYMQHKTISAIN